MDDALIMIDKNDAAGCLKLLGNGRQKYFPILPALTLVERLSA